MTTTRTRVTVEEVAADPTDCYEVTVHGDVAIESLTIHNALSNAWVYVKYAHGGSSAGCPAHWASYVRITETPECLDARNGDCAGTVEYRTPLSGTGKSFPRCDEHWGQRLDVQEGINARYPTHAPSDFDPSYAGESWGKD
jgi:hypothetical protein